MSHPDQPTTGATPLGDDQGHRRRGAWWLWLLGLIVLVVLLLLLLSRCGGDDDSADNTGGTGGAGGALATTSATATDTASDTASATPSPTSTPSATATASATGGAGGAAAGSLTAGSTSLLPLSASAGTSGDLSTYVGMPVTATGVTVQSVPADEGFWVGTSTSDRVWVQLQGDAESPYQVKKGDRVDFSGQMVAHAQGFPAQVGVTPREGAALLNSQKSHIQVQTGGVTLSAS